MLAAANRLLAYGCKWIARRFFADEAEYVAAGIEYYAARPNLPTAALKVLEAALVAGEDRRFYAHKGADLRAIVRAVLAMAFSRTRQGASTIEQQLVRTIRRRYEFTVRRKLSEILLACYASAEFSKQEIVRAYLSAAYFGWHGTGILAALNRHGFDAASLTSGQAAELIALLRYPRPQFPSPVLQEKIRKRAQYIERRLVQK